MYHRIKPLNCKPLEKLNALARLTIAFGLEQERHDVDRVIKLDFIDHFVRAGYPEAGSWLWNKDAAIRTPLLVLISLPLAEKQCILAAYDHDAQLLSNDLNDDFACLSIPAKCQAALDQVNTILENFYTYILARDGAPGDKIGEVAALTRQTVLRTYLETERGINLLVCPGCDGSPPEEEADGTIHEDVDHFFPKSRYPLLAIHPLNLTPLCKHCNQDFKSDKDPLTMADGTTLSVAATFHPYHRQARDCLELQVARGPDGLPHLRIVAKDSARHEAALKGLNHLLSLESRWDGAFRTNADKPLKQYLRLAYRGNLNEVPDAAWLERNLRITIDVIAEGIGEMERQVIAHAFAQWINTNQQEQARWLQIIQQERTDWLSARS